MFSIGMKGNHRELIESVSGLNVYTNTREAYLRAYEALCIDIINRVPGENAPLPTPNGVTREHPYLPYDFSSLGVYDTASCNNYLVNRYEDVYELNPDDFDYSDLLVPVPHSCDPDDIILRQQALGNPAAKKSARIVEQITNSTEFPIIFLHDDLASATGPLFAPEWYDDFLEKYVSWGNRDFKANIGTPEEVKDMVFSLAKIVRGIPGFAIASCGGIHGNIPMDNLEGYFDARVEVGATPEGWRTNKHV